MTSEIRIEYQYFLRYEPACHVLVCLHCKTVVFKCALKWHLEKQHTIPLKERKTLTAALESIPMIETEDKFQQPEHYSELIKGLDVHDAFHCIDCDFITKSFVLIRR